MKIGGANGEVRRRWAMVAVLVAVFSLGVVLPTAAGARVGEEEEEFGAPATIEGTVTKAGGETNLLGIEICALGAGTRNDGFAECAMTQASGKYVLKGLEAGPYRVEFKNGWYGFHYITQYWRDAATTAKATLVETAEAKTVTGIDAEMQLPSGVTVNDAPVEFGDPCELNSSTAGSAGFEFSRYGSPLPAAAPIGGVLTQWIVKTPAEYPPEMVPMNVRVVDLIGSETAEVVAKSTSEELRPGKNTFATRLPVAAGDHLALGAKLSLTPTCESFEGEPSAGAFFEPPVAQPGGKQRYLQNEFGVPVVGVVEPDEDGDGYGDETQDGCPQSAAFQTTCPPVSLAPTYAVGPRSIQLTVKSSATTPVSLTAAMPGPGFLQVKKTLRKGKATKIAVPIPASLRKRLRGLSANTTATFRFRAHATKVDGVPSTDHLAVRIPGRG